MFQIMSTVLYLEQFLESLEPLPAELKKNFNDMREMDEKLEMYKGVAESMGDVRYLNFEKCELIQYKMCYTRSIIVRRKI